MRRWARIACALAFFGSATLAACGSSDEDSDKNEIDCSTLGCAPPPMCDTGCTEACGCCSCANGEINGNLVCTGGCWAPNDGGADAAADTGSDALVEIDCSRVGCAMPPMCDTGCTEVCGCCPCAEGSTMGSFVCTGGCWSAPLDDGGADAG